MTDWIQGLGSAIGSAISTAFGALWEKVSTEIFDLFFRWLYELIFDTIADFFTMIGGMGTELFDLPWVEAYLRLFSVFGWTHVLRFAGPCVQTKKDRPDHSGRPSWCESILPLTGGFSLLLAFHAGLFVMFALTDFGQHTSARTLTLKTLEGAFQRLVLVNMNLRHLFSLPSLISPETTPLARCDAENRRMATVVVLYRVFPGASTDF